MKCSSFRKKIYHGDMEIIEVHGEKTENIVLHGFSMLSMSPW
jgi:hypothetical protein